MKKMIFIFSFMLMALLFAISAFAQVLPTNPEAPVNWAELIGALIANPKALTASFIGALVVLILVQGLKSETMGKFFKFIPDQAQFLVITILGLIYSILVNAFVIQDQEISKVLVGFLSSGGAASIFMGIKLLFPKFFETTKKTISIE